MATRLITPEELLEAPTGFDWNDVADNVNAGSPLEAIEQLRVIDRASDEACRYIFNSVDARIDATSDTETRRIGGINTNAWVENTGYLVFRTSFFPILAVTALQWAPWPAGVRFGDLQFNALDATKVLVFGEGTRKRRIIDTTMDYTFLRFGGAVQATYTNGWPNATLTNSVTAGPNVSLPVDTSVGFAPAGSGQPQNIGATAAIFDGANTETVTITTVPDGTHVQVATLQFNHAANVGISAVPPNIKLGVAWAATHFARFRGSDAVTFIGSGGGQKRSTAQPMDAMQEAHDLWDEFKIRS